MYNKDFFKTLVSKKATIIMMVETSKQVVSITYTQLPLLKVYEAFLLRQSLLIGKSIFTS